MAVSRRSVKLRPSQTLSSSLSLRSSIETTGTGTSGMAGGCIRAIGLVTMISPSTAQR